MNIPLAEIGIFALRAFVVVMFAMNVAVLLTWADRRQGAAIQDRVGPNRAVIWIPTKVAQALAVLPALGVAGGVLALLALRDLEAEVADGGEVLEAARDPVDDDAHAAPREKERGRGRACVAGRMLMRSAPPSGT